MTAIPLSMTTAPRGWKLSKEAKGRISGRDFERRKRGKP